MALFYNTGDSIVQANFARNSMGADVYLYLPGPSLNVVDQMDIYQRGVVNVAVNTAYPKVKPHWWIGMDLPECYDDNLFKEIFHKVFRKGYMFEKIDGMPLCDYPFTYFADVSIPRSGIMDMFSRNKQNSPFVWFAHTLGVVLHMLFWMGSRRIHFVGCDLGGSKDYYDDRILAEPFREKNQRLYKKQNDYLKQVHFLASRFDIELISCTPDSPINQYMKYLSLEEALRQSVVRVGKKPQKEYLHIKQIRMNEASKNLKHIYWSDPIDLQEKGIITGCDKNQEWMLQWWWDNYHEHNRYPVMFADFGMSEQGLEWCRSHGEVISLSDIQLDAWYKKPIAMQRTRFKKTIWIDLDAEIRGNLNELFTVKGFGVAEDAPNKFAVVDDPVNSGVVVYEHMNEVVTKWAEAVVGNAGYYRSDQEILQIVLNIHKIRPTILKRRWHWLRLLGDNPQALIMHWTGGEGKKVIRKQITDK